MGLHVLYFCMVPSASPNRTLQVFYFSMASPKPTPSPTKASMYFIFLWLLQNLYTLPLPPISLQSILLTSHNPTKLLSKYATHLIKPFEGTLPSYIHYSKHFIQLLESPQPYPGNIFPNPLSVCYFSSFSHRIL